MRLEKRALTPNDGDVAEVAGDTRRGSMYVNIDAESIRDRMEEMERELRSTISSEDAATNPLCAPFDRSKLRIHDDEEDDGDDDDTDDVSDEETPLTLTDIQKKISAHFDGIARHLSPRVTSPAERDTSTDVTTSRESSAEAEAVSETTHLDELVQIIVAGRRDLESGSSQDDKTSASASKRGSTSSAEKQAPAECEHTRARAGKSEYCDFKVIGTMGDYLIIGKHIEEMQNFELEPARSLQELAQQFPCTHSMQRTDRPIVHASREIRLKASPAQHVTIPPMETHYDEEIVVNQENFEYAPPTTSSTLPRAKKTTWFSSLRRKKQRKMDEMGEVTSQTSTKDGQRPRAKSQPATAHNKSVVSVQKAHGEQGDEATASSSTLVINAPHPRKRTKLCTIV